MTICVLIGQLWGSQMYLLPGAKDHSSLCVHSLPSNIWASRLPSGHENHSSLFGVVYLQVYFVTLDGVDCLNGEALSRRRHCSFVNGYQLVVVVVVLVVVVVVVIEN